VSRSDGKEVCEQLALGEGEPHRLTDSNDQNPGQRRQLPVALFHRSMGIGFADN
jgi:hypothetical protein